MQQHDGVSLSHLHIRHLVVEDPPPLLLVRKCCRDHVGFSFFVCRDRSANRRQLLLTTLCGSIRFQGGADPRGEWGSNPRSPRLSNEDALTVVVCRGSVNQRHLFVDDTGVIICGRCGYCMTSLVDLKPAHAAIPLKNTFGAAVVLKAAIAMADGSVGERLSRRCSSMG